MTGFKRFYLYVTIAGILISTLTAGCTNSANKDTSADNKKPEEAATLPLPFVPDSLRTPESRAAFVSYHFWDSMDFTTDPRSIDTLFMEQNFVNFVAMIANTDSASARLAVAHLLDCVSEAPQALDITIFVTDKYLDSPDSPMRNEDLYLHFLNELSSKEKFGDTRNTVATEKLRIAMMNRPGAIAPDVRFTTRDGRTTNLHTELTDSENLVMFYNSDCEHCAEIIESLRVSDISEYVKIIAIDVSDNRTLWDKKKFTLPKGWTVGYALDKIEENDLYYFPSLPTFYVMDSDARIRLKDPSPALLLRQ